VKKFLCLFVVLALFSAGFLSAQTELTVGRTATLGVEASTTFAWDINNNSTGLETKAGMELIFPLFPKANMGAFSDEKYPEQPTVRLLINNASFTWWNTFYTAGGNYEQDHFNKWAARPLILTFDDFFADLVWQNYFFRVASTTTIMRTNIITLRSIFDDVMESSKRFYIERNQALWHKDRYNIQEFPLLKNRIALDILDVDYRKDISGILAGGIEFDRITAALKIASRFPARATNDFDTPNTENAWLFGADAEIVPVDNFKIDISGFAGINYDKVTTSANNNGKNPISFGVFAEYQIPFSDALILMPFIGYDFLYDTVSEDINWEMGAGLMFYTRGFDTRESSRVLDYDSVIPVGASFGVNINHNNYMSLMLSWFDPAGRDSLIPNFGGFLQFEIGNMLGVKEDPAPDEFLDYAVLVQLEYSIDGKVTPYIRGGYGPQFAGAGTSIYKVPDTAIIRAAAGCYLSLVQFFSVDLRYEMRNVITTETIEMESGLLSAVFTIRM